jgi:Sulfotransferase domain
VPQSETVSNLVERGRERARSVFRVLPGPVQREVLKRTHRYGPWATGEAPVAPPPPTGMTTAPPDFVGVGVPKCGTTWWFSLIVRHPEIHVEHDKELLYFTRPYFAHYRDVGLVDEDLAAYHRWFPRPNGTKSGEWTPHYIFAYQLPPVLRQAAPQCKVLVMVRDPLERYRSDISRRTTRRRLKVVRYRGIARGYYSAALAPWEQVFAPSELLVLQFEACLRSPAEQLAATFRFLGVDDTYVPDGITVPVNRTANKRVVHRDIENLLVRLYEPDVVALAARYPQIDLRLWPNFAHLAPDQ